MDQEEREKIGKPINIFEEEQRKLDTPPIIANIALNGIFLDDAKLAVYSEAFKKKTLIMGEKRYMHNGTADFAHFDFMIAQMSGDHPQSLQYADTMLVKMQKFWVALWPYIENLTTWCEMATKRYQKEVAEHDDTLSVFAKEKIELYTFRDFIKNAPLMEQKRFYDMLSAAREKIAQRENQLLEEQKKAEVETPNKVKPIRKGP